MSEPANHRVPLRDLMEARFDALDQRLDTFCRAMGDKVGDHETRIRKMEARNLLGHVAHGVVEFGAIVLAAMGLRQP